MRGVGGKKRQSEGKTERVSVFGREGGEEKEKRVEGDSIHRGWMMLDVYGEQ